MGAAKLVLQRAIDRYRGFKDPVAFARSLGVNIKGEVRFYSMSRSMFGTEPWAITIGDNVYITAGAQFVTHDGGTLILRTREPTLEWTAPIVIGDNVYIGLETMIMPGVTIGDNVIIGARSLVTRDIPSDSVAAGHPARVIKSLDQYFEDMREKSLGLGHLAGAEKDAELQEYFRRTGR